MLDETGEPDGVGPFNQNRIAGFNEIIKALEGGRGVGHMREIHASLKLICKRRHLGADQQGKIDVGPHQRLRQRGMVKR